MLILEIAAGVVLGGMGLFLMAMFPEVFIGLIVGVPLLGLFVGVYYYILFVPH